MIPLSPDERRIVLKLQRMADAYDAAAKARPFSFNGVRAAVVRKIIAGIQAGAHR